MNNNFLPEDYTGIPEDPSRYLKLADGKNQFRVLSSAIVGYEWWIDEGDSKKPLRVRNEEDVPTELWKASDTRKRPKHFWAFVVFNRKTNGVQILEITQKSIMKSIESIIEDWGSPKEYDLVINRQKTGSEAFDVEYTVLPIPNDKAPLDAGVTEYFEELRINLEAMYEGKDPFDVTDQIDAARSQMEGTTIQE